MASVTKTKSGWRVQLYCKGVRASSTFHSEEEAVAWAAAEEGRLRNGKAVRSKVRRRSGLVKSESLADTTPLCSADEIIASAQRAELCCGIYFLIKDGKIVYVGQSLHIFQRVAAHLAVREFDSFSFIPCRKSELRRREARYIEQFMPASNYTGREQYQAERIANNGIDSKTRKNLEGTALC